MAKTNKFNNNIMTFRTLESICNYLFGFKTGQSIFDKIVKEYFLNERQDIFSK